MNDHGEEIFAQVATQLVKDSLTNIYTPISKFITVKRAQFFENFSKYCKLIHRKSSLVRTLYSKNKPMPLDEVYVQTKFHQGTKNYTDAELIDKFTSGARIIVKGNGGSGKTIFLKHLWLSRFKTPEGRIPIFVELRRLNELQSINIASFCRNELQSDMSFGKGVFEKLCEAGKFEFIFDGFDEVNRDNRKAVELQIISLSEKYRDCCFLVSGREDDRYSSWGEFQTFSVSPLSLSDVRELIDKIPFDQKVKKKFLDTLKEDFYQQHRSFLSSPLLACMMLMTFNENAIIPSKLTEFYKSAFQTLLTWHDATKDSFERDRALSVDEFRRVFSTFCLISYYDQAFEFDEELFRRYIQKSLDYHHININIDEIINDICESANLLQKDGLNYIFVHRSFQEYFAAECAMQVVSGKAQEFLEVFANRERDTVFAMCYEIHPELVYDNYFSEKIAWLKNEGFLSDVGRIKRFVYAWPHESITADCLCFDGKLHVTSARINVEESPTEALQVFYLCSKVQNQHLINLSELLFRNIFYIAENASGTNFLNSHNDASLRIVISFKDGSHKLSIRNTGRKKIPAHKTKKIRSKITSMLSDLQKKYEKNLNNYLQSVQSMIDVLVSERQAKEKSIDDILGL